MKGIKKDCIDYVILALGILALATMIYGEINFD